MGALIGCVSRSFPVLFQLDDSDISSGRLQELENQSSLVSPAEVHSDCRLGFAVFRSWHTWLAISWQGRESFQEINGLERSLKSLRSYRQQHRIRVMDLTWKLRSTPGRWWRSRASALSIWKPLHSVVLQVMKWEGLACQILYMKCSNPLIS